MTTDRITRLADALLDVGNRINEISAELRDLQPAGQPGASTSPAGQPATSATTSPTASPTAQPDSPTWSAAQPATSPAARPDSSWPAGQSSASPAGQPHSPTWPAGQPDSSTRPTGPQPGAVASPSWPTLPPPTPPKPPLWEREGAGGRLLAWTGGIVTLAGVVLLLVLAVQRGYLGPLPRVLLGAALGLALLGIGLRLHRSPAARTGAFALAATGIAVLYLDVIAATALFEYLSPAAGLAVGLVVATLGVLLAERWDTEPLAVFVVLCCALCAPVLTAGFVPLLLGFLLVLQLGATPVHLARRWGWLCLATGLPPVLGFVVTAVVTAGGDTDSAVVAFLGLVTSVAQVAVATVSVVRRPEDDSVFGLVLLAPVPAMVSASLVPPFAAVVLPGTVGALLILVWVLGYRRLPARYALAAGGAGSVAVLQATLTAFDGSVSAIVLLAQALLLTLVAHVLRYQAALWAAGMFGVVGLAATFAEAAPPALLVLPPADPVPAHVALTAGLTGLLLAVSAVAMCLVARQGVVAGGVVALYGAAAAVLSMVMLISPDRTGFLVGHVLVTVSWTVGALMLLVRGIDSATARVAGMSLVGAALVKLVLFDLSSLDGMARVAAFLVAGLVLLAAGARYAKLLATQPSRNP